MGNYKILSRDSWADTNEFLIDTEDDLNTLPKNVGSTGSTAFIAETGDKYILNNKKQWVKIKENGSDSSENNSKNFAVLNEYGKLDPSVLPESNNENNSFFIIECLYEAGTITLWQEKTSLEEIENALENNKIIIVRTYDWDGPRFIVSFADRHSYTPIESDEIGDPYRFVLCWHDFYITNVPINNSITVSLREYCMRGDGSVTETVKTINP